MKSTNTNEGQSTERTVDAIISSLYEDKGKKV